MKTTLSSVEIVNDIVRRVTSVVAGAHRPIALHEPTLGDREKKAVIDCLDSGWVSSAGPFIAEFEESVAEACGAAFGVATVNGTSALHTAMLASGVQADDEVLVPALTFVATANAVRYLNAIPHFVDASPDTLGIDPGALRAHLEAISEMKAGRLRNTQTGRTISAVVPVHVFGHLAEMDALAEVARDFGLAVIEDATEALGSHFKGRPVGLSAPVAVVSFNGNKIVTTGGGGMLLTNDAVLAKRMKHLTSTAKMPHAWAFEHDEVGFNYRLPNLNAALGLAQMTRLKGFVADKRALAKRYNAAFADSQFAQFFVEPAHSVSNYWLNAILIEPDHAGLRDMVLEALNAEQIHARPIWTPLNRLPMFVTMPTAGLPATDDLAARVINLPSSPFLANSGDRAR